ncbi:MAG: GAF domain-containing protein [Candidatus Marinimicrobia bacterium]|nr:GAF domain-containing protein [Candidatus Neomarinimicrobiota bacterium]
MMSGDLFWRIINIGISLSSERDTSRLMESILIEAQSITNADGGTLYLIHEKDGIVLLDYEIVRNSSLKYALGGTSGNDINFPGLPMYDPETNEPNHHSVATHVALTGESVNIEDAYNVENFDFSGAKNFDKRENYHSKSFLTVPLKNHEDDVIGVIQLINAQDKVGQLVPFHKDIEPVIEALSSFAAISLDNQSLIQSHKDLFNSIVKVIAQAIDAKSKFTSGHCSRVPDLTEMITRAACESKSQPFSDFSLDDHQWFELTVAAWLHDCGKLSTPDHILDKETKLQTIRDGIVTITTRFELLIKQKEIEYLHQVVKFPENQKELHEKFLKTIEQIKYELAFISKANVGGEFMTDEDVARVVLASEMTWEDSKGETHPVLTESEVYNLCIRKGTLNKEEREKINNHIVVTIDMLTSLPFPKYMKNVPEIAGGHHEKMDGTGYPKGLRKEDMSIPARVMALSDVFEALTAKDRPYKDPMKLSLAFSIIRKMTGDHLDSDIVKLFLESGVWKTYSKKYLYKEQIDVTDIRPYLEGL